MIKILFVCQGNTCRSPMAEYVMKNLLEKNGLANSVMVASAGCQATEGKDMSKGTKAVLTEQGIPFGVHQSAQYTAEHYVNYDYIVGIDTSNVEGVLGISGDDPQNKVHLLMDYAGESRDVNDPFATKDYNKTYDDILAGCKAMLKHIEASVS